MPRWDDFWRLLLLGGMSYAAARLAQQYVGVAPHLAIIWPLSGIGLVALLKWGRQVWPALLIASLAAHLADDVAPLPALLLAFGQTGEALLGIHLLQRGDRFNATLPRFADYLRLFSLGALAAPTVAAALALAAWAIAGAVAASDALHLWFSVWMADATGIVAVAPLALCWRSLRWPSLSAPRRVEAVLLVAALATVCAIVFADWQPQRFRALAHPYLTFPFLIWAALSFGRRGATLATFLILAIASLDASRQQSHFGVGPMDTGHLQFWLFAMVLSITGMFLATLLTQLRATERQLRRRTEDLHDSEARFRSMADFANVLIWVSGPDRRVTWCNRTWLSFTGHCLGEELGDGWYAGVHPDDLRQRVQTYHEAFEARRPFEAEYRLRHHSGEYRWVVDNGAPRFDDDGNFLGYCGSCWDVTDRKQAEAALQAREAELRSIYDATHAAIFFVDADGRVSHANRRMSDMFRYPREELPGRPYVQLLDPDDRESAESAMTAMMANAIESFSIERRYRRSDGSEFWGHLTGRQLLNEDGSIKGLVGVIVDVSARKEAEARLRLAAQVFEASHEGIMITDAGNRIVTVNRAFTNITGYPATEVLGQNPRVLGSGRQPAAFYTALWQQVKETGHWEGEVWNRHKDGHIYPEWLSISAVYGDDHSITNYVGIIADISERKATEDRIRHLAQYDYLTDLPNRLLLFDRLNQTIATARRYDRRFGVLFIDLDNFKPINDRYGHGAGDIVLREIAQRLKYCVRESDTVARQGGDEFVIVVPELPHADHMAELAQKLLDIIGTPCEVDGHQLVVTASIGISTFPDDGDSVDALLHHADAAMYRAKYNGRNVSSFGDDVRGSR